MINFEPCNPPLMDPLFLSCISLGSDTTPKPRLHLQQDLKISLEPRQLTKTFPLRPIAIRPNVESSSPPRNQSDQAAPNFTVSPQQPSLALNPHRCVSPTTCTSPNCLHRNTRFRPVPSSSALITPLHSNETSLRNPLTSEQTKKISPTPSYQKPVRSSPYSPKTSPNTTPNNSKAERRRNERQGISESQCSILKEWFTRYTYLTIEHRKIVSQETGLPEKTVMYWFQNQRRKVKRQHSQTSSSQ